MTWKLKEQHSQPPVLPESPWAEKIYHRRQVWRKKIGDFGDEISSQLLWWIFILGKTWANWTMDSEYFVRKWQKSSRPVDMISLFDSSTNSTALSLYCASSTSSIIVGPRTPAKAGRWFSVGVVNRILPSRRYGQKRPKVASTSFVITRCHVQTTTLFESQEVALHRIMLKKQTTSKKSSEVEFTFHDVWQENSHFQHLNFDSWGNESPGWRSSKVPAVAEDPLFPVPKQKTQASWNHLSLWNALGRSTRTDGDGNVKGIASFWRKRDVKMGESVGFYKFKNVGETW